MNSDDTRDSRPESEYNQSPEDAEQTLERVTDAFVSLNADWEFTYLNSGAAELLDQSATELIGSTIWEEFPEPTNQAFKPQFETAIETQSPVHFEEYYPPLETWLRVQAYPSETDLSVYFQDITDEKQYKDRLATIHKTSQQLMRAETPANIADITVKSAKTVLGFPAVALYYWNDEAGVLEPAAATETVAESYDDGLPTLSGNESVMWYVFVAGETQVFDESQPPHDTLYNPNPSIQSRVVIPIGNHGVILAGTETGGETVNESVELLEILVGNVEAALDRTEREQALSEKDDRLEHTTEQLSEQTRINDIMREITQALIQATQQTDIETAVCDKLAAVDGYQLAWFGEREAQTDELTIHATSGDGQPYLDQLVNTDRDDRPPIPAEKALERGEPIFTENILAASSQDQWREAALDNGYRSIATLPIEFHEATYGILEIYADSPNAFADEERAVLRELTEFIGNALSAIERKEALLADTFVELTFRLEESESVVSRLATSLDCEITVGSVLSRPDDRWLVYFTAADIAPETVVETARQYTAVESIEHIRPANEGQLFGLTQDTLSGLEFLAEKGATITSITATPSQTDMTVTVPQSVHVRSFIQLYTTRYPSAELVRRQQVSEADAGIAHDNLRNELTDQQQTAVEAALEGGFFAWPRDKTGEEIADSLGVTAPTFHRHLRVALEKILSEVFE